MTENLILSKLFDSGCEFEINSNYGAFIWFVVGDNGIEYNRERIVLFNKNLEPTEVEFSEIKDINVTDKTITFIMQDSGHNFKDGDKKVLRRKCKC